MEIIGPSSPVVILPICHCHLLQTPPLVVSSIKVNPEVSSQYLQVSIPEISNRISGLLHCEHHWCVAIDVLFVNREIGQSWVA